MLILWSTGTLNHAQKTSIKLACIIINFQLCNWLEWSHTGLCRTQNVSGQMEKTSWKSGWKRANIELIKISFKTVPKNSKILPRLLKNYFLFSYLHLRDKLYLNWKTKTANNALRNTNYPPNSQPNLDWVFCTHLIKLLPKTHSHFMITILWHFPCK